MQNYFTKKFRRFVVSKLVKLSDELIRWFHEYLDTTNLRNYLHLQYIRINKQTQFYEKNRNFAVLKFVKLFDKLIIGQTYLTIFCQSTWEGTDFKL